MSKLSQKTTLRGFEHFSRFERNLKTRFIVSINEKELMKTFLEIYKFVWQLPDILNGLKFYKKICQSATKNS